VSIIKKYPEECGRCWINELDFLAIEENNSDERSSNQQLKDLDQNTKQRLSIMSTRVNIASGCMKKLLQDGSRSG
jgi:hypothetical protein